MDKLTDRLRKVASKIEVTGEATTDWSDEADNSWGAGYYPLPVRILSIIKRTTDWKPETHRVFPDDGTHLLMGKHKNKFDIGVADLQSLIKYGKLERIRVEDNKLKLYFGGEPLDMNEGHGRATSRKK